MRKTVLIILAILITNLLAVDKYSSREIIPTINRSIAAKDTSWHSYYSEMYYLWQEKEERVTLIKADDFGLEYPVNLHGVSSYLFEAGYNFTYKIYDTDGITLLWNSAELISVTDFNDLLLDTLMIMTDDFYLSILPDAIGMPRQASSNITGSNHSYYGSPSEWLPFYDADERYEWVTQVSLTQFEGLDTHPPIVRSLTGNKNFMDVDANLNLIVQDASNVISPINAEYTLDGGSTWNSFTMNSLKGNYSFSGIVSGQPDGAVGSVKFFLEDSLSNSQWSEEYPLFWSKENLLIDEGFEGDIFPPNGWSMQIIDSTGTGFDKYQTGGYSGDVYSGNYCAEHFYGELENFSDDWLITPLVDIPTGKPTFFSFWQKGYDVDYIVNSIHEVGISTDKVAWDIVYSGFPPGGETGIGDVWEYINLSLAAYSGQKVYIGFHYNANYEDVWMIDDVQAFIDFEGPAISSISANPALLPNIGAFANNDMDIKLNVSDKSGVASITGHYTFDGGSTYTNLDFLPFKFENEVWKGIIPALPTETIGLINFTMIDSIGNTIDSDQYDIHFVDDNEVVSVENFEHQRPVFVNDSIDISVTFNDESTIDSCKAYYSNDNWTTQDEIIMTASKYHSYTYTGIIPAEMTETFGKVKFGITDSSDNTLVTDEYEVEWLEGSLIYFDDFDGNHIFADWDYSDGGWGYNTTSYYSPVKSVSDSPNGNYYNNYTNTLHSKNFDFSTIMGATMYFRGSIDLEESADYLYIEASIDNGVTWIELANFTGNHLDWYSYSIDIGVLATEPNVEFRFKVVSDEYVVGQGVDIDDIKIAGYTKDYSSPMINYAGPTNLVIGTTDYNFEVNLTDISDISEVKVVYSVDGGGEQTSYPTIASGSSGIYNMVIPAIESGAKVNYKIVATDSSLFLNSSETKMYEVYSGNYLYYENGSEFVDFYDMIGNSDQATAYALAKRITMGPVEGKGHYKSDLVGLTIGNYSSVDNSSSPLELHIWADAGGFPGDDIITPFSVEQGSTIETPYALTMVDLRAYSTDLAGLEGDIFVGFTSLGESTNILYEIAENHIAEPGYMKYKRSWLGNGNELGIAWTLDEADVYHISAIIGDYTLIDAPLAPLNLTGRGGNGNIILDWAEGVDDDIDHYNIYRGDSTNFIVGAPIGTTLFSEGTTFVDTEPAGGDTEGYFYYKITAVDVDNNESDLSNEVKINPSGIDEYLPLTTELYQNYPNPFNPETTINFSTSQTGNAKLLVYNSKGEVVSSLIDRELSSGYHTINFNGSNLVSGVYYYTLTTDTETFIHKMVLLK